MKRLITAVAVLSLSALSTLPATSRADDPEMRAHHPNGAVGFRDSDAPLGVRWWLGEQRVGIDLGLGLGSDPSLQGYADTHVSHWALDVGVPVVVQSWPRVHLIARPGILYRSQQVETSTFPAPRTTDNATLMSISGEFEAEVFLVDRVSISGSEGIAFNSFNPPGPGSSISSWSTTGRNFTTLGFHVYFLGNGGSSGGGGKHHH